MSELQTQYQAHKARLARLNGTYRDEVLPDLKAKAKNERIEKLEKQVLVLELALKDLQKRFNSLRVQGDQDELTVVGEQRPTIRHIKETVRTYFSLHPVELDSNGRTAPVAYARHIFMYLARVHTIQSFPKIAQLLGKRDHTTVLHGFHKMTRMVRSDWKVAYDIAMIEQRL